MISTTEPLIPLTLVDAWAKEVTTSGHKKSIKKTIIQIGVGVSKNCLARLGGNIEHTGCQPDQAGGGGADAARVPPGCAPLAADALPPCY